MLLLGVTNMVLRAASGVKCGFAFFIGVTNGGMLPRESCVYLHHHYGALSTILELLVPVDGGPEKGRIVYSKFPGPLGQQLAGFGGQRAGSRPSRSALSCRCVVVGESCDVPACWIWPLLIGSWRRQQGSEVAAEVMRHRGDLHRTARLVQLR
jgi:hypothetical protein